MPDIANGTGGDGGRRARRPFVEHAGEVTRKKALTDEESAPAAEEPPPFTGPKLGGARDIRRKPTNDISTDDSGLLPNSLLTLGGVNARLNNGSRQTAPSNSHLLAAQPGWRRYWGTLTREQVSFWSARTDVVLSDFCYECHQRQQNCSTTGHTEAGADIVCGHCAIESRKCLFVISYRYHPDEDSDIGRVPEYTMRAFAMNWQAAQRTPLRIDTMNTASQLQPPSWLGSRPPDLTSGASHTQLRKGQSNSKAEEAQIDTSYRRDVHDGTNPNSFLTSTSRLDLSIPRLGGNESEQSTALPSVFDVEGTPWVGLEACFPSFPQWRHGKPERWINGRPEGRVQRPLGQRAEDIAKREKPTDDECTRDSTQLPLPTGPDIGGEQVFLSKSNHTSRIKDGDAAERKTSDQSPDRVERKSQPKHLPKAKERIPLDQQRDAYNEYAEIRTKDSYHGLGDGSSFLRVNTPPLTSPYNLLTQRDPLGRSTYIYRSTNAAIGEQCAKAPSGWRCDVPINPSTRACIFVHASWTCVIHCHC